MRDTPAMYRVGHSRPIPGRIGPMRAAVHYTAAHEYAETGGDLYDVLQTPYGLRAVVGDVEGKGLGAVETAAAVLGTFREAAHQEPALDRLAKRLADALDRMPGRDGERFVTAVLIGVHHDGTAEVVNCGHPSPLLLRDTESVRSLDPPVRVPPLGVLPPDQAGPPVLPRYAAGDPGEALRRLNRDVLRHVGRRLDDDAAMVLLEYAPQPAKTHS